MNKRKVFTLFIVLAMVMSMLSLYSNAESVIDDRAKYYAVIFGTTPEEVIDAQNTNGKIVFERMLEGMLESRKFTNDMYNLENNIDTSNVELLLTISECAELFDVTEQEVSEHIEICGVNVYNKFINNFNEFEEVSNINNSRGAGTGDIVYVQYWDRFYSGATTGNIFLTKDADISSYTHGHAGVIQCHTEPKYITEAVGILPFNNTDEVVCRNINEVDHWYAASTLCSMYPNTATVDQRLTAGNHTLYYAIEDNYTYEAFSTKTKTRNSSYTKVNCASLAYRVYYFMAQFDIIPQVGVDQTILPSHIYYSPNMNQKYVKENADGTKVGPHITDNFDNIEWD